LEVEEAWLYDDGFAAKKNEYVSRLTDLKKFSDPIQKRYQEYNL